MFCCFHCRVTLRRLPLTATARAHPSVLLTFLDLFLLKVVVIGSLLPGDPEAPCQDGYSVRSTEARSVLLVRSHNASEHGFD